MTGGDVVVPMVLEGGDSPPVLALKIQEALQHTLVSIGSQEIISREVSFTIPKAEIT